MLSNLTQYSPQGLNSLQGLMPQFQFGHELAQNPYQQQSPWLQNPGSHHSPLSAFGGAAGANVPVQQIVPILAQLAQQIAVQSAVAQQIGIAVHQLAHQLATQGLGQGLGGGQAFAAPQPFIGGGQGFGQGYAPSQPFIGGGAQPFGLGGFNPQQAQAWGANRAQTIQ